jgi:hypothetical protein
MSAQLKWLVKLLFTMLTLVGLVETGRKRGRL